MELLADLGVGILVLGIDHRLHPQLQVRGGALPRILEQPRHHLYRFRRELYLLKESGPRHHLHRRVCLHQLVIQ